MKKRVVLVLKREAPFKSIMPDEIRKIGIKNPVKPKNCKIKSAEIAPNEPKIF